MVFRIFNSATDDAAASGFFITLLATIAIGINGGIVFLLLGILKKRKLKYSFVYNFFATLNIMIGFAGLLLPTVEGRPSPYIVTASLAIGVVMYKTIYTGNKERSIKAGV